MLGIETRDERIAEANRVALQRGTQSLLRESPLRFGMTVGKGQVRLDVEDGRTAHQVGTLHLNRRPVWRMQIDAENADRRKADVVGTERAPRSENAHPTVAAKTGRTNRRLPFRPITTRLAEVPKQPDVAEPLQPPQSLGVAILGLENNPAPQPLDKAALTRHSELGGEIRLDMGDRFQFHFLNSL